ncbi:MAG: hypothetical protein ACRDOK_25825 [Streptosporangiaceae bacterium]
MAGGDVSDSLQLTSLPPLFLDLVAAGYGDAIPAERCVDDCLILIYAYAQLGIAAQVRAAELVITRASAGQDITYGTLAPWWEDGMLHGHTVCVDTESGAPRRRHRRAVHRDRRVPRRTGHRRMPGVPRQR